MSANSSPERTHLGPQLIPPKRLLNSILDRLQKKDKFGVFAEPVDEKEVPNYYDIIKDPMDFSTMRSRIISGHYTSLENFQRDISLICDNAMQYNGKGTIYFRHARAIKDAAERILDDLKLSGLSVEMDETTTKLKNGGSFKINDKYETSMNAGSPSETRTDNLDEVSGCLKASAWTDGRRSQTYDENCRSTYAPLATLDQASDSLLTTISGDSLHLVPTGYQMDCPYSKSLTRFAADLGPFVWKIAAEKIKKSLPPGSPFGPGWVGEREAGGVMLPSSSKQGLTGQVTSWQTAKLTCANGTVAASEMSLLPSLKSKPENPWDLHPNHGTGSKNDSHPSHQDSTMGLQENRSPVVFGNSLAQIEKPEGADPQTLGQSLPMPNILGAGNGRSFGHSCWESPRKLEQSSLLVGIKSKFAGQVNLNNPVSLALDEGGNIDDLASARDPGLNGRDVSEAKAALPGSSAPQVGNLGGLPFVTSRALQTGKLSPVKSRMGETGMNIAIKNQQDARIDSQANSFNPSNGSSLVKAGSIAMNDANYQHTNSHVTSGPIMAHNLNVSLQQSLAKSREVNIYDPSCSPLSQPQLAQVFAIQGKVNVVTQKTAESKQHPNSGDRLRSSDVSLPDQRLSTLPTLPCSERVIGERLCDSGDTREREMLNPAGRMPSGGVLAAAPRKEYFPETGFAIQHLEGKNGQIFSPDMVSGVASNLVQLNKRQNAGGSLSAASFPNTMLPSSDSAAMASEAGSWVPAQQTDSVRVNGKSGAKFQSSVMKYPLECSDLSSYGVPLMRLQTSGSQDPQAYSFGSKKQKSAMPHFLQQQLVSRSSHGLSNQNHQMQLQVASNSLLSGTRTSSPSSSAESNAVRQFQPPSQFNFSQASNLPWQYMSPQLVAHGSYQSPLAVAPDLNVSLPLSKSSFDQPNGNEVQQPDLALQL